MGVALLVDDVVVPTREGELHGGIERVEGPRATMEGWLHQQTNGIGGEVVELEPLYQRLHEILKGSCQNDAPNWPL